MRPLLLVLVAACGSAAGEPGAGAPPPLGEVTAVTFNVHGADAINDDVVGQAIADQLAGLAPGVASLQECVGCDVLLARLPAGYALAEGWQDSELGILYATAEWDAVDTGVIVLGENDDGWGRREARWADLVSRRDGGEIRVYSTHFCVSIRNTDDACDVARQVEYLRAIADDIDGSGRSAVLGGDLNVFDGFEDGEVVQYALERGLVDTLREITGEPVVTFEGNTWAPAGRIDYVLTTAPVSVSDASVAASSSSDHRPVTATLAFR